MSKSNDHDPNICVPKELDLSSEPEEGSTASSSSSDDEAVLLNTSSFGSSRGDRRRSSASGDWSTSSSGSHSETEPDTAGQSQGQGKCDTTIYVLTETTRRRSLFHHLRKTKHGFLLLLLKVEFHSFYVVSSLCSCLPFKGV